MSGSRMGQSAMATSLLSGGTLLIDQSVRDEAEAFVDTVADRAPAHLEFVLEDGERIAIPDGLASFVGRVFQGLANGPVSIQMTPDELTTTVAADMLGVSRPTLMKWVRSGELSAHKVGSHTRIKTTDVIAFRKSLSQQRRKAFAALRVWDEQFED